VTSSWPPSSGSASAPSIGGSPRPPGTGHRAICSEAACVTRLLETTSEPVDQIRRSAGYGDPAAFRRAFKQATGLSPNGDRNRYGPRPAGRDPAS
jgi:hypothetical protein